MSRRARAKEKQEKEALKAKSGNSIRKRRYKAMADAGEEGKRERMRASRHREESQSPQFTSTVEHHYPNGPSSYNRRLDMSIQEFPPHCPEDYSFPRFYQSALRKWFCYGVRDSEFFLKSGCHMCGYRN